MIKLPEPHLWTEDEVGIKGKSLQFPQPFFSGQTLLDTAHLKLLVTLWGMRVSAAQ
jgi:hypothetical protein